MEEPSRYEAVQREANRVLEAREGIRDLCARMARGDINVAAFVAGLQPVQNELKTSGDRLEGIAADICGERS